MSMKRKFIKKDEAGIWVKFKRYTHIDETKPDVVLMPMIHVADNNFFQNAKQWRWNCDIVLYEHAEGKFGRLASWVFRILAKCLGLTLQGRSRNNSLKQDKQKNNQGHKPVQQGYVCVEQTTRTRLDGQSERVITYNCSCGECPVKTMRYVHADLNQEERREVLAGLPFWVFPMMAIYAIGAAIEIMLFGRREDILDGTDSGDSVFADWLREPETSWRYKIAYYIMPRRDAKLIEVLHTEIMGPDSTDKVVGVEFGAKHMRSVQRFLRHEMRYRIDEAEWLLAICIDDACNADQVTPVLVADSQIPQNAGLASEYADQTTEVDLVALAKTQENYYVFPYEINRNISVDLGQSPSYVPASIR